MKRLGRVGLTLTIWTLLWGGFIGAPIGCEKPVAYPHLIEDVTMEAGGSSSTIRFYARFKSKQGRRMITRGTLEVEVYQRNKLLYTQTIPVLEENFIPYGVGGHMQFESEPYLTNEFKFEPLINRVGWFDHQLQARFLAPNQPVLKFSSHYKFKSIYDEDKALFKDNPKTSP